MDNRASILIELLLRLVMELREIEYQKVSSGVQHGDLTPEESLEERLLEKNEYDLLALMNMPTHPTQH